MEINFSELNNLNTKNPYENFDYDNYQQNSANYWDNSNNTEIKHKKKKVSFDDILTNMNLVVNREGVLQFMTPSQPENPHDIFYYNQPQMKKNNPNVRQINYSPNNINIDQNQNNEPLAPEVKHSYIYNKYFKDYVDPNAQKMKPRVPKTIEEYKQMLLDDKIKAIQHKIMVEKIKSKKLLFVSAPGSQNPKNIKATKNNLRSMNLS